MRADAKVIVFPRTVKRVLDGAFGGATVRSVVLNEGLERLGGLHGEDGAHCSGVFSGALIRQVTLPSTLRVLGDYTFAKCALLARVTFREPAGAGGAGLPDVGPGGVVFPPTLEKVGCGLFDDCPGIRAIWVRDCSAVGPIRESNGSVAVLPLEALVGDRPLWDLRRQRDVVVPEGVREIGAQWFRDTDVESVTVPGSVEKIGEDAFRDCRRLGRVQFQEQGQPALKRIEQRAFWGCRSLRGIALPRGVEHIGQWCFFRSGLEEFAAPPGLREVGDRAFSYCQGLRRVTLNEGLETLDDAFVGAGIEVLVLPGTLKSVGQHAFADCSRLGTVYVGEGFAASLLGRVPASAKVYPPSGTMAGSARVWDLRGLREAVVPDGTERIGAYWFWGSDVERVVLPASVREVSASAFCNCRRLREVVFREGSKLRELEGHTFCGCSGLARVLLPDGLRKIGNHCFSGCGIREFRAPPGLREIGVGNEALLLCEDGRHVVLGEGLEVLGRNAGPYAGMFYGALLESVAFSASLREVPEQAFYGCDRLEEVRLPGSVRAVGARAFSCCWSLRSVCFSEGLERVCFGAFSGCRIQGLLFPASLLEIGEGAFYDNALAEVAFREGSRLEAVGGHAFGENPLLSRDVVFPRDALVAGDAFADYGE